jgi:hypothetical protein
MELFSHIGDVCDYLDGYVQLVKVEATFENTRISSSGTVRQALSSPLLPKAAANEPTRIHPQSLSPSRSMARPQLCLAASVQRVSLATEPEPLRTPDSRTVSATTAQPTSSSRLKSTATRWKPVVKAWSLCPLPLRMARAPAFTSRSRRVRTARAETAKSPTRTSLESITC